MKIKTSELIGPALDWAVVFAINLQFPETVAQDDSGRFYDWSPSTVWSQGGPILEREGITTRRVHDGTWRADFSEAVLKPDGSAYAYFQKKGPNPLIAAMRCYVASKLGEEIDVPEF